MRRDSRVYLAWGICLTSIFASCENDTPPPPPAQSIPRGTVQLSEMQMRAADIATSVVEVETIHEPVRVPGTVQPPDTSQVVVGSIVDGRVVLVHVLPGDVVRRGEPLIEIHSHELMSAQRDLVAATAEMTFRTNALERSELLLDAGAVSLEEVERRRADHESANADLVHAREIIEHLHPSDAGNVTMVAERSGTVFKVHAKAGQAVLPGSPLVEMGSTDILWLTAFVPENASHRLSMGDEVQVRFGSPDIFGTARMVRAGTYVDPGNRSIEYRFELDSIPANVRPGSFAVIDVPSTEAFDGVELDEQAAVRIGDEDFVFVVEGNGSFRAVPVAAVSLRDGRIAVRGLPDRVEIVTRGAYFLRAALEGATPEPVGDGT